MTRGGAREGAGRPPLNLTRVTVQLSDEQIDRVNVWREKYQCKTFSDALRQILDSRWLRKKLHNVEL
jgi:hypothetical protein